MTNDSKPRYKVERQLDEVMPDAAWPHSAGVSFDLRLYFRENEDGYQWASVAFLDRANGHKRIDEMPLHGPGVISWFFGEIAERGFPLAVEKRTASSD